MSSTVKLNSSMSDLRKPHDALKEQDLLNQEKEQQA